MFDYRAAAQKVLAEVRKGANGGLPSEGVAHILIVDDHVVTWTGTDEVGTSDFTLRVWNLNDLTPRFTLDRHRARILAVEALADHTIISRSEDEMIYRWSMSAGTYLDEISTRAAAWAHPEWAAATSRTPITKREHGGELWTRWDARDVLGVSRKDARETTLEWHGSSVTHALSIHSHGRLVAYDGNRVIVLELRRGAAAAEWR